MRRSTWSSTPELPASLRSHVRFAQKLLSRSGISISGTMRKYQLSLADRQCRMSEISLTLQNAIVMLVTALYAAESRDAVTVEAADAVCRELRRRITGERILDADFRQVTRLGTLIAEEGWAELNDVASDEILMPYKRGTSN